MLDFVCYADRLVIEVDGSAYDFDARFRHDERRDAVLAREGFRTLWFAASGVMPNLEGVSLAIRGDLGVVAPHPGPPHKGEGEE